MDIKNIFSEKTTIDITVVKLQNQKLTKSIFNQLHWHFPFDENMNFTSVLIFGHVNIDNTTIGIGRGVNKLFKFDLGKIRTLAYSCSPISGAKHADRKVNLQSLLGSNNIKNEYKNENDDFDSDELNDFKTVKDILTSEGLEILNEISQRAKNLIKEINSRQILL